MKWIKIIAVLLLLVSMTACTSTKSVEFESTAEHRNLVEETEYGSIHMTFDHMEGTNIRTFSAVKDQDFDFEYEYLVTKGSIELEFRDGEDQLIDRIILSEEEYRSMKEDLEEEGEHQVNIQSFGSQKSIMSRSDKMKVVIIGDDAEGMLHIRWEQ